MAEQHTDVLFTEEQLIGGHVIFKQDGYDTVAGNKYVIINVFDYHFFEKQGLTIIDEIGDEQDYIFPSDDYIVIPNRSAKSRGTSTTTELIREWAVERNLHTADPRAQALKLGEEFGELFEGLAKNNDELTKDAIGDIYVVLTILSQQLGFTIEECIDIAYDEIKDRRGKMIDGVFVKESDLDGEDE